MSLRQITAVAMLILGGWLVYEAILAINAFTSRGGDLASALFEPPTGIIRIVGAGLMALGGLIAALNVKGGGTTALAGAVIFMSLGGLMAGSGADQGLWMDELIYGLGGIALAGLILTFKRV